MNKFILIAILSFCSCAQDTNQLHPANSNKATATWHRYADIGSDSGIDSYAYGEDFVQIKFKTGEVFEYTTKSAGSANIKKLIKLAEAGDGLNTFLSRNVRKKYSRKWR